MQKLRTFIEIPVLLSKRFFALLSCVITPKSAYRLVAVCLRKWHTDNTARRGKIKKAIELCGLFNCSLDDLFRNDMVACGEEYTNLRIAKKCGVDSPRVIGWDFPNVSQEQINVFNMHGYEAAWILPDGVNPPDLEIHEQAAHKYAAIHIATPFENPFVTIPNGYKTLMEYMRVNGLEHTERDVIPCFETGGESMDIYIACQYCFTKNPFV